ncbi:hypothetical protein F2Q68_00008386 [Brassica cretica]|uniref:Uncharacterized protein n=1 Tax=Brassica cretica TaxID=69181 RepID=A0A8S9L322_BRACR|nr:hypothetical protein F2Q68_00008386 [Brassica cretica]
MNLFTSGAELMTRWNWDCINREEWLLSDLLSHAGVYVFPRTTFMEFSVMRLVSR